MLKPPHWGYLTVLILIDKASNLLDASVIKKKLIVMQSTMNKGEVCLEYAINQVKNGKNADKHYHKALG